MLKNKLSVLALSAIMLAVIASGTASAATWNGMSDVSEYRWANGATYYSWIDITGYASVGQQLSWYNALNNKEPGLTVKPAVIYTEDLDNMNGANTITNKYYGTLSVNQAWAVIQYTNATVRTDSVRDVGVEHGYYDMDGYLVGMTRENVQRFNIV